MQSSYLTIAPYGEKEIEIQRSRFICRAKHVKTEEEALQFIQEIQKKHWDATHNCYAYKVTELIQKSSDDGEPAGTAGKPILEVIHQRKLLYTAIVVTRYFGGIKLGAGGLIRAYSRGAVEAIEAAGTIENRLEQELTITFDYHHLGKLEHELRNTSLGLETPQFAEQVSWTIWIPIGTEKAWQEKLNNWTSGQISIRLGQQKYRQYPLTE